MAVLEISVNLTPTPDRAASARILIDDREYLVIGGTSSATVITGKWIRDRRSLGKTFYSLASLIAHYKRDGKVLAEYATKLSKVMP